jgi:hypothetical protein
MGIGGTCEFPITPPGAVSAKDLWASKAKYVLRWQYLASPAFSMASTFRPANYRDERLQAADAINYTMFIITAVLIIGRVALLILA